MRVFEQFVQERNRRPPAACDSDSAQSGTDSETQERLVADPLQATPSELAAGLRALVRELRRPGGEPYPPDLIHYLLLGGWPHFVAQREIQCCLFDGKISCIV